MPSPSGSSTRRRTASVETKVFTRRKGQTFAQVTGEAPERLVCFRPAVDDGAPLLT